MGTHLRPSPSLHAAANLAAVHQVEYASLVNTGAVLLSYLRHAVVWAWVGLRRSIPGISKQRIIGETHTWHVPTWANTVLNEITINRHPYRNASRGVTRYK